MTICRIIDRSIGRPASRPIIRVGGFAPTDISDLKLWLDAADTDTLTLRSSVYVEEWRDKSGQGNDFSQATEARQPSWGADEVNFAAFLAHLTAGSNYIFSESDGLSIVALAQSSSSVGPFQFIFDFGLFSSAGYGVGFDQSRIGSYTPSHLSTDFFVVGSNYRRVSNIIEFGIDQKIYVDNSEALSGVITTPSLTATNIAESPTQNPGFSGPMTVGKLSNGDTLSRAFTGKMKQLLIYAKKLTIQERTALDSYLAAIP